MSNRSVALAACLALLAVSARGQVKPDLSITAVSGPATADAGATISVSVTVENVGTLDVVLDFPVEVYLSTDNVIELSDILLGEWLVTGGLTIGASQSNTFDVTIPGTVATDTYYLGAYADPANIVKPEETLANNWLAAAATIDVTYIANPDLVMTAVTAPATVTAGDSIDVDSTVQNQGDGDSAGFFVELYLSDDQTFDAADTYLDEWEVASGLVVDDTASATTAVTIPGAVPAGTYYVIAYADYDGTIDELDETNNSAASGGIDVTNAQPNLVITAVTGPAAADARTSITVTNTVRNNGSQDAAEFRVGIYLSSDQTIEPGTDLLLGSWTVTGGLAAAASAPNDTQVTIPGTVLSGAYFIGAYADYGAVVIESDETDNWDVDAGGIDITNLSPEQPVSPFDGGACSAGAGVRLRAAWFVPLALAIALAALAAGCRRGGHRAEGARSGATLVLAAVAMVSMVAGCTCGGLAAAELPDATETAAACMPAGTECLAPALPAFMPGEIRRSPMGARLGVLTPAAAQDEDYSTSAVAGAFWPGRIGRKKGKYGIPFEVGLDVARIDADNGLYDALLYLVRCDFLFSKWPAPLKKPDFYLLGGLQAIVAQQDGGDGDVETVPGLDLGVGLNWGGFGWDVRLTYSALVGSGNIGGLTLITGAYSF